MNAQRRFAVHLVDRGTSRRGALRWAALGAVLALSACGFRLRGPQKMAFQVLRLQGSTGTSVAQELGLALESAGVRVLSPARPVTPVPMSAQGDTPPAIQPQVVLTVLQDRRERAVVGQTAAGQVRELQLRVRFGFNLSTPAGKVLIDDTELLLERDISYSETAALAKETEEALLYRDMQSDIVQQVMRRLAAVTAL